MKKLILCTLLCILSVGVSCIHADWLDETALAIVRQGKWDNATVINVIKKHIQLDQERIDKIEFTLNDPQLGIAERTYLGGALRIERLRKRSHERILKAFEEACGQIPVRGTTEYTERITDEVRNRQHILVERFKKIITLHSEIKLLEYQPSFKAHAKAKLLRGELYLYKLYVKGALGLQPSFEL